MGILCISSSSRWIKNSSRSKGPSNSLSFILYMDANITHSLLNLNASQINHWSITDWLQIDRISQMYISNSPLERGGAKRRGVLIWNFNFLFEDFGVCKLPPIIPLSGGYVISVMSRLLIRWLKLKSAWGFESFESSDECKYDLEYQECIFKIFRMHKSSRIEITNIQQQYSTDAFPTGNYVLLTAPLHLRLHHKQSEGTVFFPNYIDTLKTISYIYILQFRASLEDGMLKSRGSRSYKFIN